MQYWSEKQIKDAVKAQKKYGDQRFMDGALFMAAIMGAIMIVCAWVYGG